MTELKKNEKTDIYSTIVAVITKHQNFIFGFFYTLFFLDENLIREKDLKKDPVVFIFIFNSLTHSK